MSSATGSLTDEVFDTAFDCMLDSTDAIIDELSETALRDYTDIPGLHSATSRGHSYY